MSGGASRIFVNRRAVLITFFLAAITGGHGQIVSLRVEQSHFSLPFSRGQGSLRQAIMYDYNKSNDKVSKSKNCGSKYGVRLGSSLLPGARKDL